MSRAFVKEDDQGPPPPPLERAVSAAPNLVTPSGARAIDEEVARLEREIAAMPEGDAAELLKRDLRYWTARRATARLVQPEAAPEAVGFGAFATIRRDGRTSRIRIVGEDEADPENGLIAWTSPLARALEEAEPGETVEMEAGGRTVAIQVLAVESGAA